MKRRTNWWIVSSILILCIPVGFVLTGVIKKGLSDKSSRTTEKEMTITDEAICDTIENQINDLQGIAASNSNQMVDSINKEIIIEKKVDEVKSEVTPNRVATNSRNEELKLEKEEEKKLREHQKEEERLRKIAEKEERDRQKAEAARKAEEERKAEQTRQEELKRKKEEERRLIQRQKEEERLRKIAEKEERDRQKAESARKAEEEQKAEQARKLQIAKEQFINEVKSIVVSGKSSSKVPENCVVVVNNNQTTNYQNFRNGVKLRSYSGVKVTKVEGDGIATRIYVSARVESADD